MLELLAHSCRTVEIEGETYVLMGELTGFVSNLRKAISTKDVSFLFQKRGLRFDRIVDVQEFVESAEYLGQAGYARRKVVEGLWKLFHGGEHIECVLTGSIGWGKTYFGYCAVGYMLYQLSCYHSPQVEFDMAPGTSIVFIQQSKTFNLAKKVVFEQFTELIRPSPYFRRHFPFDTGVKSELRFPKNVSVLPVGGNDTAALGMNVFGGVIDEMNFMQRSRDSVNIQYTHEDEFDQAERLYTTVRRRMKSRFMQRGGLTPGKLLLVSSVNYPGDFTSRKLDEARRDKSILAISYNQWEVLPDKLFSGKKFLVEVGNELKQSRLLYKGIEEALDASDVIEVPEEYLGDFERDLEGALRDLAGVTTGTRNPFIPYRSEIAAASAAYKEATPMGQLFRVDSVIINSAIDPDTPDWESLVNTEYLEEFLMDRTQPFAAHVDVSLSEDCCGVALGHISGYKMMKSARFFDPRQNDFVEVQDVRAPVYTIDGVLRIMPPKGAGEIDLGLVRDLLLWLRSQLFVRWATMDSYQSAMMIQAFRKARMRAGVLSVDQSIAPYTELKLAIKDERILFPDHPVLKKELREVEKMPDRDKIDHPPGASKDCSDAVAGVVYILHTKEANYGRASSGRRRRTAAKYAEEEARPVRRLIIGGGKGRRLRGI